MATLRRIVIPEFMFGLDAIDQCGNYASNLGAKNVLLVTDRGVSETGLIEPIVNSLMSYDINFNIFDNVTPNPKDYEVMEGSELFLRKKCDSVVAVGGGSPIDCAKGIAIVSSNGGHIRDYEGVDMIPEPIVPMICIPTTSGTSADVSQFAIITNTEEKYKMAIISKMVVPDIALIDPQTLLTMDSSLTAATGMDALTHAIEAYVSKASSDYTDMHALDAVRLIKKNLELCINDLGNIEYRTNMMRASLEAGVAFSNASLGAVHAMAHSLGGLLDLPHGECNAVLLPHVIRHNFINSPDKYMNIAKIFGFSGDILDLESGKKFLIESIFNLNSNIGIKKGIGELGAGINDLKQLSEKSVNDPCMITNPKELDAYEVSKIYKESY